MAQNESFRIFFAVLVSALLFWRTFGIFYVYEKNFSINISRAVEQFSDGIRLPTKMLDTYLLWIFPDSTDSRLKFDPDPEQFFPYF